MQYSNYERNILEGRFQNDNIFAKKIFTTNYATKADSYPTLLRVLQQIRLQALALQQLLP